MTSDEQYLKLALDQAHIAYDLGEVPVGAVIVIDNTVIAKAHNMKESMKDSTAHAEILAIKQAQIAMNDWRLNDCRIYSTLEPCPMCMGAILHSRLSTLTFSAYDIKWGAAGTKVSLHTCNFNHSLSVSYISDVESGNLLRSFFSKLRKE
jgi:tRNA(adenine34) deaminase